MVDRPAKHVKSSAHLFMDAQRYRSSVPGVAGQRTGYLWALARSWPTSMRSFRKGSGRSTRAGSGRAASEIAPTHRAMSTA